VCIDSSVIFVNDKPVVLRVVVDTFSIILLEPVALVIISVPMETLTLVTSIVLVLEAIAVCEVYISGDSVILDGLLVGDIIVCM
jgi:hypothetical protein